MTQNEKDILLKDLCARLPYGVKADVINEDNEHCIVTIGEGNIGHLGKGFWIECKPYLFPLSNMSEEQKEEFNTRSLELQLKVIDDEIMYEKATEFEVDFYNKHHLDWRGLIPIGLAIDATGKNIY